MSWDEGRRIPTISEYITSEFDPTLLGQDSRMKEARWAGNVDRFGETRNTKEF
jgi:hypothetical protein